MLSSISNFSPLLRDLKSQKSQLLAYGLKTLLFLGILFAADRGINLWLMSGIDRFFGLNRPAKVLCIGHSRTALGINELALERDLGVPVVKYAHNGARMVDRLAMIRHYFSRQPNSVRLVIYDVDSYTFNDEGLSANSYELFFPYIDNPEIRAHLRQNTPSRLEFELRRFIHTFRFDETTLAFAFRGLLGKQENLKRGTVDIARLNNIIARGENRKSQLNPHSLMVFQQTLHFIRSRGAKVVLAYIPVVDVLNSVDRRAQERIVNIYRQCAAQDPGVIFCDYNREYEHRYDLFYDGIHMNIKGQQVVTDRLRADIQSLKLFKPLKDHGVVVSRLRPSALEGGSE